MRSRHPSAALVASLRTRRPPNFRVGRRQTLFHRIETTFSDWRCREDPARMRVISGFRNIRPPSNAPSVPSDSLAPTICGPTFARTQTNALSCVRYVPRRLLVSMIGNATKDSTLARRNLSVAGISNPAGSGDVGDGLRAPMPSVAISVAKLVGSVYVRYWRRRRPNDTAIICFRKDK